MDKLVQKMSLCDKKQALVVSQDKKSKNTCRHIARNTDACNVAQFQLDGDIFQLDGNIFQGHEVRCDFLVLNQDKKNAYFIELKGSNIMHAKQQVESSVNLLRDDLTGYSCFFRIIFRSQTQEVRSSKVIRWKEHCGKIKYQL